LSCSPAGSKDYVSENIANASRTRRTSSDSAHVRLTGATCDAPSHHQCAQEPDWRARPEYGKVPRYLLERKMQLAVHYAQQQVVVMYNNAATYLYM
jgi:hypothetical protein